MARSGLARRTALGTATLLIGANLPDLDVLAYLDGPAADLSFRRGWTHGIPALIVLPLLLTGAILAFDGAGRRLGRRGLPSGVVPREVLILAAISVLTHHILDTLNTYGVRWLMPFRGDWFYGDTLFIVDPWLWLILGLGVALSAWRTARGPGGAEGRPAQIALAIGAAYIVLMSAGGVVARGIARQDLEQLGGGRVEHLMVAPDPVTPMTRRVVAVQGGRYRVGSFGWLSRPHVTSASLRDYPIARPDDPAVAAAALTRLGRRFLGWARFPTVLVERSPDGGSLVHLIDLRYTEAPGAGFGSVSIPVVSSR